MKKYAFILSVFSLITIHSFAQNEVLNLPIDYNSEFFDGKKSLAISNEKTGELVLFIEDSEDTKVVLLNKDFKLSSQIKAQRLPSSFKTFIGYQINDNGVYSIFFTNTSGRKYGVFTLDFKTKKTEVHILDFKLKKETYIEGITFKEAFYLMSVTKRGSDIHFYTFDEQGTLLNKNTVSLSFIDTEKYKQFPKRAYHHLVSGLVKMDNNIPNAIETTSKSNKLYQIDDQLVFTFDNDSTKTKVAKISPETFSLETIEFDKPIIPKTFVSKDNSYLFDDKLFQIIVSPNEMRFSIKDFKTKALLKEIVLKKEDSITFKNTPIIQEGPGLIWGTRTRKMEETNKFLRKITRGSLGISVLKQDENYKVVLGSHVIINRSSPGFGGPMMMPMGSFGAVSVGFNPVFSAYGGYSSTKSVHIDCLFDNTFNHVKGEITENIFDNIKSFEDFLSDGETVKNQEAYSKFKHLSINVTPKLKNVFKHNEKIYFAFLGKEDKNFHIIEFTN